MNKFRRLILSLIYLSLTVGALFPQLAMAEFKFAVVDVQRALTASKLGMDAQKRYELQVKKAQTEIDEKKKEFDKANDSLVKQKDSLNAKALSDKQEQLITLEKELKRSFQDQKETLGRENSRIVGDLVRKIRNIVEEYGKEHNYTVVLEKGFQGVLYAGGDVDITDDIVKRFDNDAP
jgi:outer membrane protein